MAGGRIKGMITGEIGRIDTLLKTIDEQQDSLEERLEVLASQVPEDEEDINTTVVDEVGIERDITGDMNSKPLRFPPMHRCRM